MSKDLKELQKLIGCRLCEKILYTIEEQLYIKLCRYCTDFYNSKITDFTATGVEKIDRLEFREGEDTYLVKSSNNPSLFEINSPFDTTLAPPHRPLLDEIDDFCK